MTPTSKRAFKAHVQEWAEKLEVPFESLTVRPMANKWASCSTAGNLTFNSELLMFEEELQRFVIVHELLHFRIPNHGRLWKSLMRVHLGAYEDLEARLKALAVHSEGQA